MLGAAQWQRAKHAPAFSQQHNSASWLSAGEADDLPRPAREAREGVAEVTRQPLAHWQRALQLGHVGERRRQGARMLVHTGGHVRGGDGKGESRA